MSDPFDSARDVWRSGSAPLAFALRELPAYFMRQRWYPAKDAGLPALSIEHIAPLPVGGYPSAHIVWQASPTNGAAFRVAMPLALVTDLSGVDERAIVGRLPSSQEFLIDATGLDPVVRTLVSSMLGDLEVDGLNFHHTAAITATEFARAANTAWPVKRSRVEQSNTSIRVGTEGIFKLIRKLERGIHPELEMARYLTGRVDFTATPQLFGWIDAGDTTLAIMQAFVANDGDGWTWLLEQLHRGVADAGLSWLHKLGLRTGELHVALGQESDDPAFAPEDIRQEDWQVWKQGTLAMARRAVEGLDAGRAGLDETTQAAALDYRQRAARLDHLLSALLPGGGLRKTRHHGDYHLGQVLVHDDDAIIVDFEGEPMRSLAERRAKHNALRDVAGMLRSLDYAAAVAGREAGAREAGGAAYDHRAWLGAATQSFLAGYFERAATAPGCPHDRASALRLVQFFIVEKALYEILYELANRPAWVAIPLQSINRTLAAAEHDDLSL
jgi:trehalose synthase-fused probable maltokinase